MNKFSKYLIILGILCILLSITLYIKNKYQELDTGKKSKEILDIIETKINVSDKEEIKSNTVFARFGIMCAIFILCFSNILLIVYHNKVLFN